MIATAVKAIARPIRTRLVTWLSTVCSTGETGWYSSTVKAQAESMKSPSPAASIRHSGQCPRSAPRIAPMRLRRAGPRPGFGRSGGYVGGQLGGGRALDQPHWTAAPHRRRNGSASSLERQAGIGTGSRSCVCVVWARRRVARTRSGSPRSFQCTSPTGRTASRSGRAVRTCREKSMEGRPQ